jgi:hypothetical protein
MRRSRHSQARLSLTIYLVSHYYMEERLATLLLLGAILRAFDDPSHVYHSQCRAIATDILIEDSSVFLEFLIV